MKAYKIFRFVGTLKNPYEVLKISPHSDQVTIKKAYLTLAKQFHPDSPEGNEENFKLISEAYDILKNEEKKAEFDKSSEKNVKKQQKNPLDSRSTHENHKRYKEVFKSSAWSNQQFSDTKPFEKNESPDVRPSDVLMKMGMYIFTSASIAFTIYICYLIFKPIEIETKEKIVKPEGIVTKRPERLPPKLT